MEREHRWFIDDLRSLNGLLDQVLAVDSAYKLLFLRLSALLGGLHRIFVGTILHGLVWFTTAIEFKRRDRIAYILCKVLDKL